MAKKGRALRRNKWVTPWMLVSNAEVEKQLEEL